MRALLVLAVATALFAGHAHGAALSPCKGGALKGSFAVVPGSAGAGNIVYALRLRNVSPTACTVSGLPDVRLLDRRHRVLPTHAVAAHPGQLTAVLVRLAPGRWTSASARFSPDVPGPGEPVSRRRCEPTAYAMRIRAPGRGMAVVPIRPPTPVCEHGGMQLSAYVLGRTPPGA